MQKPQSPLGILIHPTQMNVLPKTDCSPLLPSNFCFFLLSISTKISYASCYTSQALLNTFSVGEQMQPLSVLFWQLCSKWNCYYFHIMDKSCAQKKPPLPICCAAFELGPGQAFSSYSIIIYSGSRYHLPNASALILLPLSKLPW